MIAREPYSSVRSYLVVFAGVLFAHFLFLWWAIAFPISATKQKSPQRLVVRSVHLTPRQHQPQPQIVQPVAMTQVAPTPELPQDEIAPPKAETPPPPPKPAPEPVKPTPEPLKPAPAKPKPPEPAKPIEKPKESNPKPKPAEKPKETKPKPKPAEKPQPKPVEKAPEKPKPQKKPEPPAPPKPTPEEIAAQAAAKAAKEAAKAKQRELVAKAQENLAKMGETRDKIASTKTGDLSQTAIPQMIGSLKIDALPTLDSTEGELSSKEISYRDEVAYRLKLALKLPDYGEVKLKLTLDRTGKVASVNIISSESAKNKQYIEKTVPSMTFPVFGSRFGLASQFSFMVSLQNEK